MGDERSKNEALGDPEFAPIRVSTLRGDLKIPFDVFVRVAGKHILYCRRGDSFEGLRLERLKAKRLRTMYIRADADLSYRQYLETNIDRAYDTKSGKSLAVRTEVIQGFQQAVTEEYMEKPMEQMGYDHLFSSAQRFSEFVQRERAAVQTVLSLKNDEKNIAHHGLTVATLTLAMLMENGLADKTPMAKIAMGCFLHDVDHFTSGIVLDKPLAQMTPDELKVYRDHPMRSARYLHEISFIDQLVFQIITQHEENSNGSGFPKGLSESQMDPSVIYVATANAFDRLVCFEGMDSKDAIKKVRIESVGLYPLEHLQTLYKILKSCGLG